MLLAFGGNATLLVVIGFLARSLLQTWLTKDIKKFESDLKAAADFESERLRADLKAQGDVSVEQLKSRLQQVAFEHQVRFSRLHEKRANVIEELNARLDELEIKGQRYVGSVGRGWDEQYFQWRDMFIECNSFLQSKRIYLTEAISLQVSNYLDGVKKSPIKMWVLTSAGESERPSHELLQQYREEIIAAIEDSNTKIPAMRDALIKEFRAILDGSARLVKYIPSSEAQPFLEEPPPWLFDTHAMMHGIGQHRYPGFFALDNSTR